VIGIKSLYLAFALVTFGAFNAPFAFAQNTSSANHIAMRRLMAFVKAGNYAKALSLIESLDEIKNTPEGIRLRVQFLIALNRPNDAIILLEQRLANSPDDAIARFQLGEINYNAKRDKAAKFSYQLALSGKIGDVQREIAMTRLEAIKSRRPLQFSASFEITPDSNYNSATSANEIEIFGLPFVLDENAKPKSGLVSKISLGLRQNIKLSEKAIWHTQFQADMNDAPQATADYGALNANIGTEFKINKTDTLGFDALYGINYFGHHPMEKYEGFKLGWTRYVGNIAQKFDVQGRNFHSENFPTRQGNGISLDYNRTKFLSPSSYNELGFGISRRKMLYDTDSYGQTYINFGATRPFYFKTLLQSQFSIIEKKFDEMSFAYFTKRYDLSYGLNIRASLRDRLILGAHPYIGGEFTHTQSNINLYKYNRQRIIFGFSREF
jgi:outer membrane protein